MIALIAAIAALNRLRGDATWLGWLGLPGRTLWYIAPAVGLAAWAAQPWPVAAAFAVAYLVWAVPAWGHLYGLGRYSPDRAVDRFTAVLLKIASGNVHGAFFLRHLALLPGLGLVSIASGNIWFAGAAIPAALIIVAGYEAGWRWAPRQPILAAELIAGAVWGALILAA